MAVLPGEWLTASDGGSLHCPDHYDLTLEKSTRIRVMQLGFLPRFVLDTGQAAIHFGKDSFFFDTPALSVGVIGTGKDQWLTFSSDDKHQAMGCGQGIVAMDFEIKESAAKPLLLSRLCQMELALNGGAVKRYIRAGDRVNSENLILPRHFWPELSNIPVVQLSPAPANDLGMILSFTPSTDGLKIQWRASGVEQGATCTVYGQKNDAANNFQQASIGLNQQGQQITEPHQNGGNEKRIFGREAKGSPKCSVGKSRFIIGQADEFAAAKQGLTGK